MSNQLTKKYTAKLTKKYTAKLTKESQGGISPEKNEERLMKDQKRGDCFGAFYKERCERISMTTFEKHAPESAGAWRRRVF
jgi:hypothetical protein